MAFQNDNEGAAIARPAKRRSEWLLLACYALFLFGPFAILPTHGQTVTREYDLKAVLLFNLVQFVEWPATVFKSPDDPIVIGILGRDPFGAVLDNVVRDEKVGGRKVVVKRFTTLAAARESHVLFISRSEESRFLRILSDLRGTPILSVSDIENFARRGGMVRFFINSESKIKLRINIDKVKQNGLTISSKLLRVAEVERSKS